jgi:DNA helicase-2/ATP-dependent DNA helicase PcrA
VGVTRAKERLYLYRAFRRGFRGGSEPGQPSQFLSDIPRRLVVASPTGAERERVGVRTAPSDPSKAARPSPVAAAVKGNDTGPVSPPSKPSLSTGDRVRHAHFGEGIVTGTKPSKGDVEVTVAFKDGQGVKRLLLSIAPLEKAD